MSRCKCGARAIGGPQCPACVSGASWRAYDVHVMVSGAVRLVSIVAGGGVVSAQDAQGRAIRQARATDPGAYLVGLPEARALGWPEAIVAGVIRLAA